MVAPCSGTRNASLNLRQDEQLKAPDPLTQLPGAATSENYYLQNSLLSLVFQISPKPSLTARVPGICLWPRSYGDIQPDFSCSTSRLLSREPLLRTPRGAQAGTQAAAVLPCRMPPTWWVPSDTNAIRCVFCPATS